MAFIVTPRRSSFSALGYLLALFYLLSHFQLVLFLFCLFVVFPRFPLKSLLVSGRVLFRISFWVHEGVFLTNTVFLSLLAPFFSRLLPSFPFLLGHMKVDQRWCVIKALLRVFWGCCPIYFSVFLFGFQFLFCTVGGTTYGRRYESAAILLCLQTGGRRGLSRQVDSMAVSCPCLRCWRSCRRSAGLALLKVERHQLSQREEE